MHVLIAPNAFKNSLPADAAAKAILLGLEGSRPRGLEGSRPRGLEGSRPGGLVGSRPGRLEGSRAGMTAECFPVGDGGDGTGDLLIQRLGADRVDVPTHDPIGRERTASFGLTADGTAIIEMASASGIRLLAGKELDPLHASSRGTGDLIRAALDRGALRILLGIGGSATIDGGLGILTVLGIRFNDGDGHDITTPADLTGLVSIDVSGLDPRLKNTTLTILCDVSNPPLGPNGAAAVFGPQKGASPGDVVLLESVLGRLCDVVLATTGKELSRLPSGGAAGAAAAGLYGLLGARLVSGIDYFLQITDFDDALSRSDLVITGEGAIDEQTLQGKAPYGVAIQAKRRGIPVIALTGRLPDDPVPLRPYFDEIIPINPPGMPLAEALAATAAHLTATAGELGRRLEWGHR